MIRAFRKAYSLLTSKERRRLVGVFVVMVAAAVLEAAGVGSVMPFLSVITDPSTVQQNALLQTLYDGLGFTETTTFLLFFGGLVLLIVVSTQLVAALSKWLQVHLVYDVGHNLSVRLMKEYLSRPYPHFIERNTAEMRKNVIEESNRVVAGLLKPGLTAVSNALIAVAILGLLFWVNPWVTVGVVLTVGGLYAVLYVKLKNILQDMGERRNEANESRYRLAAEVFGGAKELKVLGREEPQVDRYSDSSRDFADYNAKLGIYRQLPGYLMRALTFGGLMGILLFFLVSGAPISEIIPAVGLFAFAGYRLMPALEKILSSIARFRFYEELMHEIHHDLTEGFQEREIGADAGRPLPFRDRVELRDVTYRYPGADEPVLEDVDLTIEKNTTIAFAGETGAGKTTIVDLILGLLEPEEGEILVDGDPLSREDVPRWQRNFGYVPQEIFLTDDTITRNIALGLPDEEIDDESVRKAAKLAHIHRFIEDLPNGYETVVGERGVRLSGGQRQRIGIARALYHDPPILVMDEATSDIDQATEREISKAIQDLSREKTLIIIAHRLNTTKHCDCIHVVDDGRIAARGRYAELIEDSPRFQQLAQSLS